MGPWLKLVFLPLLCLKLAMETESVYVQQTRQQAGTCETNCQQGIDASMDYAASLHQEGTKNHDTLVKRVVKLENEVHAHSNMQPILSRITSLEKYLKANTTAIKNQLDADYKILYDHTSHEAALLIQKYDLKFKNLTAELNKLKKVSQQDHVNHADHAEVNGVFTKVTKRIDTLENTKVSNLTKDNELWRHNFRAINTTFERIKKNNNCLCK